MANEGAIYKSIRVKGIQDDEELVVHMVRRGNDIAVELQVPGGPPVVINQKQLNGIYRWVEKEFVELGKIERFVN